MHGHILPTSAGGRKRHGTGNRENEGEGDGGGLGFGVIALIPRCGGLSSLRELPSGRPGRTPCDPAAVN
jgi:hypothetical protein